MKRTQAGLSLLEMLIAIAVLGVFLLVMSSTLTTSQNFTNKQTTSADLETALRLSFFRMSEVIQQASYIYPVDQKLSLDSLASFATVSSKSYVTGANALAVLVPEGTSYCPGTGQTYCAYLYAIEDRKDYASVLPDTPGNTGKALVEWRVTGIDWLKETLPTTTWTNASWGIIADSIDDSASSLGAAANMTLTNNRSGFDDKVFNGGVVTSPNALINSVQSRITLLQNKGQKDEISLGRANEAFARAIPRAALPNPN